jgi:PAS domain S-box-containing protein
MNLSFHVKDTLSKTRTRQAYRVVWATNKKTVVRFAFALALLVGIGVSAYQTTLAFREAELEEARVESVSAKLEVISSQLKDAEIGQHGYLITGDQRYLEPYSVAVQTINQELQDLRALTAANPSHQRKIDMLAPLIAAKFAEVAQTNGLRKSQGFEAAAQVVLTHQGRQLTDEIRRLVGDLKSEQAQLLLHETGDVEAPQALVLGSIFGSFVAIMLAAFLIIRDIIERKRADDALRESAARFHRLAENALDMIYRYRLSPTPSYEYVSSAATAISGYTPEDFYADPDLGYKLVHPEDRSLIEGIKHPSGSTVPFTARWIHKNGTIIWTSQQLVPIYGPDGKPVAIEGIVRDITERVEAYRMLEQRVEERTHEIERRRQVAEGLRDTLTILNSNRPLGEILDSIVSQACRLLETDAGAVYRLEEQEELFSIQAACGLDADDAALSIPVGWGTMGQTILSRQPVAVSHVVVAPHDAAESTIAEESRAGLARLCQRYRAMLAVPLLVKDAVYGAIVLYHRAPRGFSNEEIEMAVAFSDQAALAIENARLRVQAEQMAVAAERSRLARDLHDAVTQTLFSTSLIADVLPRLWERNAAEARQRLNELRLLTRGALAEMRTLLLELRPATLTEVGLAELLRQLSEALISRARVPVSLTVEGQCQLPPDVQIALYRIAQEALNNVARHAGAGQAIVSLRCQPQAVELCISDDGRGFDPAHVAHDHLGVGIMRERAEAIDALLRVDSRPGCGTQIVVVWPDKRAAPAGQIGAEKRSGLQRVAVPGGGYE